MDQSELLVAMRGAVASLDRPEEQDAELLAMRQERARVIREFFASRDYKDAPPPEPYADPISPLVVGFRVGMPEVLGGTIGGVAAPIRWLDSAINGEDESWLSSVAGALERGGNWVSEHPWINAESVARFRATMAHPVISDDGMPIWNPASWVTDADGNIDVHRRVWEAARTVSGSIGESILPFFAELALTRGAGTLMRMGTMGKTALSIGAMSSVQAQQGYADAIRAGVDPDIAARSATVFGAITGPIEYAELVLGSKLFKGAAAKAGAATGLTGVFDWTAQKILGDSAKYALVRAAGGEAAEEVIQGSLENPMRAYAYAAMRERKGADWQPATDEWYTLNDAYNDAAVAAAGAGFLRLTGRAFGSMVAGKKKAAAVAAGQPTQNAPATAQEESTLGMAGSTDQTPIPRGAIEQQLQTWADAIEKNGAPPDTVPEGVGLTHDDWLQATYMYGEDRDAGLKFISDRLNATVLDDGKPMTSRLTVEEVADRNTRLATDESTARRFLDDASATDRPVGQPTWAPNAGADSVVTRPIEQAKTTSDLAMKVYLGLPERLDGVILPAEREAIEALRKELGEIWKVSPDAEVRRNLAGVVSYTPEQAKQAGIQVKEGLDAEGRVLARVPASVRFGKDGKAIITLPRGFTLRDVRQAKVQLLGTENGADKAGSPWNTAARSLQGAVKGWWNRVGQGVTATAAADPALNLNSEPDAGKRSGLLSQKVAQIRQAAQAEGKDLHISVLDAMTRSLQTPNLSLDAHNALNTRLDTMARGLASTSEAAKARKLVSLMRKNPVAGLAHLVARPEQAPTGTELTKDEANAITKAMNGNLLNDVSMSAVAILAPLQAEFERQKNPVATTEQAQATKEVQEREQADSERDRELNEIKKDVEALEEEEGEPSQPLASRTITVEPYKDKRGGEGFKWSAVDRYGNQRDGVMPTKREALRDATEWANRTDYVMSEEVRKFKEQVEGEQRNQLVSESLSDITPAELDARIEQVARAMKGTVLTAPDGSKTLRVGQYEMVIEKVSQITTRDGGQAAGSIVRLRNTAMAGKLVGWRVRLSDRSNATTAAHEAVHAAIDLLEADEKTSLAAEMGKTSLDESVSETETAEESVTQQIAVAIATGKEFGTVGSKARIVWEKIKGLIDSMLHMEFGEAWSAVKTLAIELRADAVKGMIQRGEVFGREGTQRTADESVQAEWQYDRNLVDRNVRSVVAGRANSGKTMLAPEDLIYLVSESQPMLNRERSALRRNIELVMKDLVDAGAVVPSTILTDAGRESQGWSIVDAAKLSNADTRYQRLARTIVTKDGKFVTIPAQRNPSDAKSAAQAAVVMERESGIIQGAMKTRAELIPLIDKLRVQLADSKEALLTERAIVSTVGKLTKETPANIPKFEAASVNADAALAALSSKKATLPLYGALQNATDMLESLGVNTKEGATLTLLRSLNLQQMKQLLRGMSRGMDSYLLRYHRANARAALKLAGFIDRKGAWQQDYRGENPAALMADARKFMAEREKGATREWQYWKSLGAQVQYAVDLHNKALTAAAKAQIEGEKALDADTRDELRKAVAANPLLTNKWHIGLVDFLGTANSVFKRMGPMIHELFYRRIQVATDKATALMRQVKAIYGEERMRLGVDEDTAAMEKIAVSIHGRNVEMTRNQFWHILGCLTDPQTWRDIRKGNPVIFSEQKASQAWGDPSVVNLFVPAGTVDLEWYNWKLKKYTRAKQSPGKDWKSFELMKGVADFMRSCTEQDFKVVAAQKNAFKPAMLAVNETEKKRRGTAQHFPEEAFGHTDEAITSAMNADLGMTLPKGIVWGYTPRFRDMDVARKVFASGAEYQALELASVLRERKTNLKEPLVIHDIQQVVDRRSSQMARVAYLMDDIRRALDLLNNPHKVTDSFDKQLETVYGPRIKDDLAAYLSRAAGFGHASEVLPQWENLVRNALVGRLAFRPTSYLSNRYVSIVTLRQWMVEDGGISKDIANDFAKHATGPMDIDKGEGWLAVQKMIADPNTGYFWKRWMRDMLKVYTQVDMADPLISKQWDLRTRKWQDIAMSWFSTAEGKVAAAAWLEYRKAGLSEQEATAKVEAGFRATQNPCDALEECAALRRMKQANWSFLFPYIGQTMIVRNLAMDAFTTLKDPNKRGAATAMLTAVALSMVASETFRALIRKAIRWEPEEEEEKRRQKNAMNVLRDAMGTLAPGVGDALMTMLAGNTNDKGLIGRAFTDLIELPLLSGKYMVADETAAAIEPKQWAEAASKTLLASATLSGIPASGGGEQLTQFLIEKVVPHTKAELGKIQKVRVVDNLPANATRSDFDRLVRTTYKEGVLAGDVDRKETSYKDFRNRYKAIVIRTQGLATAKAWGFTMTDEQKAKLKKETGQ
jgi:hypothetical protein